MQAFKAQTTARVQSTLQGVAAALSAPASAQLDGSTAELLAAQKKLTDTTAAFEAARKQVNCLAAVHLRQWHIAAL
jgi:hypothetical protein